MRRPPAREPELRNWGWLVTEVWSAVEVFRLYSCFFKWNYLQKLRKLWLVIHSALTVYPRDLEITSSRWRMGEERCTDASSITLIWNNISTIFKHIHNLQSPLPIPIVNKMDTRSIHICWDRMWPSEPQSILKAGLFVCCKELLIMQWGKK